MTSSLLGLSPVCFDTKDRNKGDEGHGFWAKHLILEDCYGLDG